MTPSPVNPLGVKGVGEAGAIASTAAAANAVIDALSGLGHPAPRHAVHVAEGLASDPVREGRPGMIPAAFEYRRATSLDDALHGHRRAATPRSWPAATSLLPLMKLRLASPGTLVDIGRLTELKGVRQLDDGAPGDRGADDVRRADGLAGRHYGLLATPCRASATSRSATAARSAGRSRMPTRPRTCRPACSRSTPSSSLARRAASGRSRSTASSGPVHDRPAAGRDPHRDPPARAARRRRVAPTCRWSSRRPGYAIVGVAAVVFAGSGGAIAHRPASP